jgi:hypothetical protein
MWSLRHEVIRIWCLLILAILLLVAQEAKGPVRQIEAAKDDDGGEDLFNHLVSIVYFFDFVFSLESWVIGRVGIRGRDCWFPDLLLEQTLVRRLVCPVLAPIGESLHLHVRPDSQPDPEQPRDEYTYHRLVAEFLDEAVEDHRKRLRSNARTRHFLRVAAHARLPHMARLYHAWHRIFAAIVIPVF